MGRLFGVRVSSFYLKYFNFKQGFGVDMSDHLKIRENLAQIEILLRYERLDTPLREKLRVVRDRLLLMLASTENDVGRSAVA